MDDVSSRWWSLTSSEQHILVDPIHQGYPKHRYEGDGRLQGQIEARKDHRLDRVDVFSPDFEVLAIEELVQLFLVRIELFLHFIKAPPLLNYYLILYNPIM